jgi:hypothetical protein
VTPALPKPDDPQFQEKVTQPASKDPKDSKAQDAKADLAVATMATSAEPDSTILDGTW